MGISYDFSVDDGTVELTGVCSDDNLGTIRLNYHYLMSRFAELKKLVDSGEANEEEEIEFEAMSEYIEPVEDYEDEDEDEEEFGSDMAPSIVRIE